MLGELPLTFIEANIHSDDESLVWIADQKILLAGDAFEDTVTYVSEPEQLAVHLEEIARIKQLGALHILPNHGDPQVIAGGGYGPGLFDATSDYIRFLLTAAKDDTVAQMPLQTLLAPHLASGALTYFEPYERVHQQNLAAVRGLG